MISGLIRLRAADGDDDVATVGELDVGPAQNRHLAAAQRPVKEQRHDHDVDQAAALGRLGALEAPAGAARPPAGGEHGGALLGGEAAGLTAPGGSVGGRRAAEALEGLAGERPGRRLLTGGAGGAPHGGDDQRGGCRSATGLKQIPQIRREARIVQPPAVEPGGELAGPLATVPRTCPARRRGPAGARRCSGQGASARCRRSLPLPPWIPSNGRRRATGSTSPSETTEPPQSGHLAGHGSRTSTTKRVRQPEHRPGRVSRRSGGVRR